MAIDVTLSRGGPSSNPGVSDGGSMWFLVSVRNLSASPVTLTSLQVGSSDVGSRVAQPSWLTPNAPPGTGAPSIAASGTATFPFRAVFPTHASGLWPSPQQPGGALGANAFGTDSFGQLQATAVVSDGSGGSATLPVPIMSDCSPFPVAIGGGLQLQQGANLVNWWYL